MLCKLDIHRRLGPGARWFNPGRAASGAGRLALGVFIGGMLVGGRVGGAPLMWQSAARPASLVELYTSEGCSSCPPAEAWFSQLKDSPGLWRDFVPVAFHVDYWNDPGWRDPWSQEAFSDRQREYARVWGSANIYTPEFVLNGAEWHRWFWQRQVPAGRGEDQGVLSASSEDGTHWRVAYALPTGSAPGLRVYLLHTALLVSGVGSDIKAGENSGRHLEHDFVALNLTEQPLVGKTNEFKGSFRVDEKLRPATGRLALAVWLVEKGKLEPVQAVGGWLPRP